MIYKSIYSSWLHGGWMEIIAVHIYDYVRKRKEELNPNLGLVWFGWLLWKYSYQVTNDQRRSLREESVHVSVQMTSLILISIPFHSIRKASLKCKTDPYKFWNWEFAPSASVVLARWSKLLLFQLHNGVAKVMVLCLLQTPEVRTQIFLPLSLAHTGVDECLLIPWVQKISTKLPN